MKSIAIIDILYVYDCDSVCVCVLACVRACVCVCVCVYVMYPVDKDGTGKNWGTEIKHFLIHIYFIYLKKTVEVKQSPRFKMIDRERERERERERLFAKLNYLQDIQ